MTLAGIAGLLGAGLALAQTAPLRNGGTPIGVEYRCTEDDMAFGGLSCSEEESCPVYLELSDAEAVGNRVFTAGNIHSSATTLYSILLASDDAGATWHEPFQRLRGVSLDHIQFIDFETGWISGQTVYPLPRDPFLLITNDGGKTWRQRNVFGETRAGAIQQFWFSSRQNGSILIEHGESSKFELFETPNGGETWMIREVSDRPIRMKRGPAANEGSLRLRADQASKAYRIERQQGERWTPLAAFLVPLRPCKPPEREEPEPQAPSEAPAPAANEAPAPVIRRTPPSLKRPPK